MAQDFPNAPTNGQIATMPNGTYVWDTVKWKPGAVSAGAFLPLAGGTMTGPILAASGTANAPSYSFSAASNSGWYYDFATPKIALATGGVDMLTANTTSGAITIPRVLAVGATTPPIDTAVGGAFSSNLAPGSISFNAYGAIGPLWKASTTGYSAYETWDKAAGTLYWWIAPSVAAGAQASPAWGMTLDNTLSLSVKNKIIANGGRIGSVVNAVNPSVYVYDTLNNFARGMWAFNSSLLFGVVDGGGSPTATHMWLDSGGNLTAYGNVWAANMSGTFGLQNFGGGYWGVRFSADGWRLQWNSANGAMQLVNSGGTFMFNVDGAGNVISNGYFIANGKDGNGYSFIGAGGLWTQNGAITTGGAINGGPIQGSWIRSTGAGQVDGDFSSNRAITWGYHYAGGFFVGGVDDTTMGMWRDDGNSIRYMRFANTWHWTWNTTNGDLTWFRAGAFWWQYRSGDVLTYNALGSVGGYGPYNNYSDERLKAEIEPATAGLPEVLQINPITFRRKPRAEDITHDPELGFSAQNLLDALPIAVRRLGLEREDGTGGYGSADPTLAVTADAVIAALVNSVKTLNARIAALEGRNSL